MRPPWISQQRDVDVAVEDVSARVRQDLTHHHQLERQHVAAVAPARRLRLPRSPPPPFCSDPPPTAAPEVPEVVPGAGGDGGGAGLVGALTPTRSQKELFTRGR